MNGYDTPLEVRATEALRAYLVSVFGDDEHIRRADDTRPREGMDWLCVIQVTNLTESWPGSENFKGNVMIGLDGVTNTLPATGDDALDQAHLDAQRDAHNQRCAWLISAFVDVVYVGEIIHGTGTRTVDDFSLVALQDTSEVGQSTTEGCYNFTLRKTIHCTNQSV